ncbi:MAG: tetratricopeptide repeat protein [Planctomycetia bacterium]|nr:tetratricopeptide repeat protein [Planctomycetia bacterium]
MPDVKQMLAYDVSAQAAIDLLHAGQVREARTKLQEIVDATPIHVASRLFLGETYADQGDLASAVAWYEAALKIKPDNPDALVHLGTAYVAQDRIPDAIARFEEALQIDEESTAARYNLGLPDWNRKSRSIDDPFLPGSTWPHCWPSRTPPAPIICYSTHCKSSPTAGKLITILERSCCCIKNRPRPLRRSPKQYASCPRTPALRRNSTARND